MATLNFPDEPTTGDVYTDSNSGFSYEWNGTVWISTDPSTASNIREIDNISSDFDGSDTTFTLKVAGVNVEPANVQQLIISVGGVMQNAGDDYTVSGSTLTFTTAPTAGLTFFGTLLGTALSLNTVADASVGSASLKTEDFTIGGSGNTVTIPGNLTVQGTETIINTNELNVQDKTIGIGSTNAPTAASQDGAGAIIYGQTHIDILYDVDKAALGISTGVSVTGFVTATRAQVGTGVTINNTGIDAGIGAGIVTANSIKAATIETTGQIDIDADSKYFRAGADQNLQIGYDGSDGIIKNLGNTSTIIIKVKGGAETAASFIPDGSVELYEDNVKRFETASDDQGGGVIVTGKIVGTAATIGTGVTINNTGIDAGNAGIVTAGTIAAPHILTFKTAGTTEIMKATEAGRVQVTGNQGLQILSSEGLDADFKISTDDGDDNSDHWRIQNRAVNNDLTLSNYATGSYVGLVSMTSYGGITLNNGQLIEKVKITAGKLSANQDINLADGMVHYFTTQETGTATPNIRIDGSTSLNSVMLAGDCISVTLITTAAAAGYSANLTIDGVAVTEEWIGGSAPSEGSSDGLDIYAYTIICTNDAATGDSGFKVIANLTNATN